MTQYVNGYQIQPEGILLSAGVGIVAGDIIGPVAVSPKYSPIPGIAASQHSTFAKLNSQFVAEGVIYNTNVIQRTMMASTLANVDAKQVTDGILSLSETFAQCLKGGCTLP